MSMLTPPPLISDALASEPRFDPQFGIESSLDPIPNPDAAKALAAFFGELRTELIAQKVPADVADNLLLQNAPYVFQNSQITIVSKQVGA